MNKFRVLYHLMRADFLERIRRYGFLVVLVATGFAGYSMVPSIDAPYNAFAVGPHRPYYSSAWVGTVFGLVVATMVSLLGFYLVRTAVARDYRTRVGQVIAATPVGKPLYMLGKWLSNLAVLCAILAVLTVVALVMQLVRAEDTQVNLWALVAPIWFMGLPVLALVAAVAIFFECLPLLRGGIGSVAYLFLWGFVLLAGTGPSFDNIETVTPGNDLIGFDRTMVDLRDSMVSLGYDPTEGVTDLYQPTEGREITRFAWDGISWNFRILIERLLWVAVAAMIALVAVLPFDRFDPARSRIPRRERTRKRRAKAETAAAGDATAASNVGSRLDPLFFADGALQSRFGPTLVAETRLMIRGQPWWWYGAALGLVITCLLTPYWVFQRFFFPLVWLWPIFLWSGMGNQEYRHRTFPLVFSCAHLVRRQLPAAWLAGVLVAIAVGSGAAARFSLAGEASSLFGWSVGVVFVPALALTLGIWTNSGRVFEIVYLLIWLLAVYSRGGVWPLDFLGRGDRSVAAGIPLYYLAVTVVLLVLAVAGRRKQITSPHR